MHTFFIPTPPILLLHFTFTSTLSTIKGQMESQYALQTCTDRSCSQMEGQPPIIWAKPANGLYFTQCPTIILTKHHVGGKSQSQLINTTAMPTWEVVTETRQPVVWSTGFHMEPSPKIYRPLWACNVLAMFIKAGDLFFNYDGSAVPRRSHKNELPCQSGWSPAGTAFYLSFGL